LHQLIHSSGKQIGSPGSKLFVSMEGMKDTYIETKVHRPDGRRSGSRKRGSLRRLKNVSPGRTTIERVCDSITAIAGLNVAKIDSALLVEKVRAIVQEAYDANSQDMGITEALEWADNFQLNEEEITESSLLFETLGYNLAALARVLQSRPGRRENRLSIERLEALDFDQNDPDMLVLKGLARDNIIVDIPKDFVRQSEKPSLRKAYL